ncbi:MAG: RNA methyltransferase [Bacilli bacterium]
MLYSSVNNQKVKDIKKLHIKKNRDMTNLFLIEGEHLVTEAYKSNSLKTLIIEENESFKLDIETINITNNISKYISELENPPKIFGICNKKNDTKIGNKVLVLDNIQDPGNLGTIIRSAVAFNIDTIILSNNTVDLYNSKVIRASQGLLFYIDIIIKDIAECLTNLNNLNYKILGTSVIKGKSVKKLEKYEKFAIIMGNEGNGLSKEIMNIPSEFIYVDMNKNCESLNVAVATSIILYELDK